MITRAIQSQRLIKLWARIKPVHVNNISDQESTMLSYGKSYYLSATIGELHFEGTYYLNLISQRHVGKNRSTKI